LGIRSGIFGKKRKTAATINRGIVLKTPFTFFLIYVKIFYVRCPVSGILRPMPGRRMNKNNGGDHHD